MNSPVTTSLMMTMICAMSANASADEKMVDAEKYNIETQLHLSQELDNILNKKVVLDNLSQSFFSIANSYGENKKTVFENYFADYADIMLGAGGIQDSTNIALPGGAVPSGSTSTTAFSVCHTACHCHCHCHGSRGWR